MTKINLQAICMVYVMRQIQIVIILKLLHVKLR
jgi:hypothetical protein